MANLEMIIKILDFILYFKRLLTNLQIKLITYFFSLERIELLLNQGTEVQEITINTNHCRHKRNIKYHKKLLEVKLLF